MVFVVYPSLDRCRAMGVDFTPRVMMLGKLRHELKWDVWGEGANAKNEKSSIKTGTLLSGEGGDVGCSC